MLDGVVRLFNGRERLHCARLEDGTMAKKKYIVLWTSLTSGIRQMYWLMDLQ